MCNPEKLDGTRFEVFAEILNAFVNTMSVCLSGKTSAVNVLTFSSGFGEPRIVLEFWGWNAFRNVLRVPTCF